MEEKGGDPFGSNRFLGRAKNYPLCKPMVDHDHERVEAGGHREICDKVTGDLLKRARSNGFDGRQGRHSGVCVDLVLLAKSAAFDISADVGGEAGPPEFGRDQLTCFQEAGMTRGLVIVATLEDGATEEVVGGNVDTPFVHKDAGLDLPVGQARTEGKRNVLVHGLESLEDEGVAGGGGFNAVGEGSVNEVNEEGRREKGDVSVVGVIGGEEVGPAGEGIGASQEFARNMDHF